MGTWSGVNTPPCADRAGTWLWSRTQQLFQDDPSFLLLAVAEQTQRRLCRSDENEQRRRTADFVPTCPNLYGLCSGRPVERLLEDVGNRPVVQRAEFDLLQVVLRN